jgi:hypothetical protein
MLHHPFEYPIDLLTVDGYTYELYTDAFYACKRLHAHPDDYYTDVAADDPHAVVSKYKDSDHSDDRNEPLADFGVFARRPPGNHDVTCSFTNDLGTREIDRLYDWMSHVSCNPVLPVTWELFKRQHATEQAVTIDADPSLLNTEQRKLYDVVTAQYTDELARCNSRALLLNMDGLAGSSKTFTLLIICARLQELAQQAGRPNPVLRAAPTGVAAFNIVGRTLHSLFRLPVKHKVAGPYTCYSPVAPGALYWNPVRDH